MTILMPGSLAIFESPIVSSSMSKMKGEYSTSMAESRSRDLGDSDMFDFPGSREGEHHDSRVRGGGDSLDELYHGVFDWDRGISVVEVVEVDVIDP